MTINQKVYEKFERSALSHGFEFYKTPIDLRHMSESERERYSEKNVDSRNLSALEKALFATLDRTPFLIEDLMVVTLTGGKRYKEMGFSIEKDRFISRNEIA